MRAVRAEFAHAGKIAGAKAELAPVQGLLAPEVL